MGKQWFTWAMLAAYIAIWAMVPFAGKLPAGMESPLRQSISDGFTSFLGLTIQVLIAVVGILFAGVITSQQRSLQRYGDFVLVLYRREYGYLGLYLGLTIATVLASILTGVQGWPFIIYHLLNLMRWIA